MAILAHLQERTEENQRESIFRLKCCACHPLKRNESILEKFRTESLEEKLRTH